VIRLPRPRRSARTPLCVALLIVFSSAVLSSCGGGGDGLGRPAERPAFDRDRAWIFLGQQMAFGPRYLGGRGHDRQLAWIKEQMGIRADTVVVDSFTHRAKDGKTLRLSNVLARWRPELAERVLLVAHWDTRPNADRSPDPLDRDRSVPGANDGASGVAVLTELAEMMRQQAPPVGVDVLLVDGADYGDDPADLFVGSRRFAANLPVPGYRPRYAVVLHLVGDRDARFPREAASRGANAALVDRVWGIAGQMGYDSVFVADTVAAIPDDHDALRAAGIAAVLVSDPEYGQDNQLFHTTSDLPASVSRETLGVVGDVIAELVYRGVPESEGEGKR
jgi:glutaminyl-peptide cyclotransferase